MKNITADKDFLLNTETARELYHEYAEMQPIFDYHNHLAPIDIAEHRRFNNLTELWLETDHYKWRAMRSCGIDEYYITGDAPAYEKFLRWAETLQRLIGNPLYHWTHMELYRYFGIEEALTSESAPRIWEQTQEMLRGCGYDAVSLLARMNVRVLCTTDDPADDLEWHGKIRNDSSIPFRVFPSFRPDKYLKGDKAADNKLCAKYGTQDLKIALSRALDHFSEMGAVVSDHGFSEFRYREDEHLRKIMDHLGTEYADRRMVMQLHMGAIRDVSPILYNRLGNDAGGDSVGRASDPYDLAFFLGGLEKNDKLPRTVIYNLNPADNAVFSTLAADFAPKVMFGAAWWLSDHFRGINAHLDELMETGALSSSAGMLTDSRSFTSFVRHEYYRRIFCRKLGELVENGMYPKDIDMLGQITADVCYNNAIRLFGEVSL